jgi:S-DNA-T family DNA segregation ATPase FtsK/SpoIIIE
LQWFFFLFLLYSVDTTRHMGRNKKEQRENPRKGKTKDGKTNHVALGLVLILIGSITVAGAIPTASGESSMAGSAGLLFTKGAQAAFGYGFVLIPIALITSGVLALRKRKVDATLREWITALFGMVMLLGFLSVAYENGGGAVGGALGNAVEGLFGAFAQVILFVLSVVSFILFFDRAPEVGGFFERLWEGLRETKFSELFRRHQKAIEEVDEFEEEAIPIITTPIVANEELHTPKVVPPPISENERIEIIPRRVRAGAYVAPALSLLEKDRGKADIGDVKQNTNMIKHTLKNFNIEVEMDEVTIGPTVTRYALKPAQGVRINKIASLQQDLAMALAAHPLRIEAPIPGKSLVGIEIPNRTKSMVGLRNLLEDASFQNNPNPLLVAIGRSISGKPVVKSITKMPHLLIAGTTGSGKSVTIHTLITSLLYKHGPDELRFIFVDPKRVELTLYNKIPHLLTPVITDPKRAVLALKWAATEMSRRYDIFERLSVQNIASYNEKLAKNMLPLDDDEEAEKLPYIVIIIDELADIMQAYPRELESAIVRLAQMSRAVGIHLILSTQRPEVSIITGLIKANIPSRIALRVPTQIDSRTILDQPGAEKLLGQGDMLALVDSNQPERLQSAFISEQEVKNIVKYLIDSFKDAMPGTIEINGQLSGEKASFSDSLEDESNDDDLYEEARSIVIQNQTASTSFLQRKLAIGYNRAARLIDALEARGVVGKGNGSKARDVLIKPIEGAVSDKDIHTPLEENNGILNEESL